MKATAEHFRNELHAQFERAVSRNESSVKIRAGDLHEAVGGYPGTDHNMPGCCEVMYAEQKAGDKVVAAPPKGKGASLVIEYKLPR